MRDIKFRGLNCDDKWVFGGYYKESNHGCEYITIDSFDTEVVSKGTIGQFTGLKDKNGVDIYEGDVVIYDGIPMQVRWDSSTAGFEYSDDHESHFPNHPTVETEVIGNIHENPELITDNKG